MALAKGEMGEKRSVSPKIPLNWSWASVEMVTGRENMKDREKGGMQRST